MLKIFEILLFVCVLGARGEICSKTDPTQTQPGVCTITEGPKGSNNIQEDADLKVPELVRKYGYPLEIHQVVTRDGYVYVLTMHRIPHGRIMVPNSNKKVIFIMHCLLGSSADFVIMGPGFGLAYILADAGFDVWMGNARGNRYSRQHQTLDPSGVLNYKFWQFSWDEIGNIDTPAMIDYALAYRGHQGLHYIGHSQGTTGFFALCSAQPDYCNRIISMHALAPVAYLSHSTCFLIRAVSGLAGTAGRIATLLGAGEFLPNSKLIKWAGEKFCWDKAWPQKICSSIMFLLFGWNANQHNATMMPVIMAHTPGGSSVNQVAHYGEIMSSGRFQRFDYGSLRNMFHYGSWKPPLYDLSKVRVPVYLYYSLDDPFAHVKDVERLWGELGNVIDKIIVPMSHLDFLYGIEAKEYVYDRIIKRIHEMANLRTIVLSEK